MMSLHSDTRKVSASKVAFASLIGTAIEFYDFYIYAMAAAMVVGEVFFSAADPAAQALNAMLTFGLAFFARPLGALLFGHFGDRYGRKSTLSASLLLMGGATMLIGLLPGYALIGIWAPILLCVLRFIQGVGLGGEWGGAALVATEYAPEGQRGWYGMFPQMGPPLGFLLATLSFLGLTLYMPETAFKAWGWRIPFLASALLVMVGLYVRLQLLETPAFTQALVAQQTHRWPLRALLKQHGLRIVLGAFAMAICYQLFYTATVFCLSYGTQTLRIPRAQFLWMLSLAVVCMAAIIPLVAAWSDRRGRTRVMMTGCCLAMMLGCGMQPLMGSGNIWLVTMFLCLALTLMGWIFSPMGAFLPELFPVDVRYSGAGLTYQLGGILGASFAPAMAQALVSAGGLSYVGGYVSVVAFLSWLALKLLGRFINNLD